MLKFLRQKFTHYRTKRAVRLLKGNTEVVADFLQANQSVAMSLLRQRPELSNDIVLRALDSAGWINSSGRQTIQFPTVANLGYGYGLSQSKTLPKLTPYNLRRFSEVPPARRAINLVKYPIESLSWNVVPFMYVGDYNKPLTPEQKLKREICMNCLNTPNNDESWRILMSQVLEDLIVGGYGSIELAKTSNRLRPYFLFAVDGASIRVSPDWSGDMTEPRYVQSYAYNGVSGIGGESVDLLDSELIYMRLHARSNTPFGLGYLEVAFNAVNAWLGAFSFSERRASNATPSYGINLGEDADINEVREFRRYWIDQIEGYGNVPIWGGGENAKVMEFRTGGEDELFLKWQEMLIRIIAMAFGLTALSLGIERDINRSTAGSLQIEEWSNIKPIITLVEDYITRRFIWKALGYRDMEFKFTVQDSDEKRQAEIINMRWESDSITVNEIREIYDKDPLEEPWGSYTKSRYTAAAQAEQRPETLGGLL